MGIIPHWQRLPPISEPLPNFIPGTSKKEDKVFFPLSREYFTDEEDQAILDEFMEFDRKMIHEKYKAVVDGLEI